MEFSHVFAHVELPWKKFSMAIQVELPWREHIKNSMETGRRAYIKHIKQNVCVFFVPYARPQFWADLHEIWHVASSYPTDG